MTLHVPAYIHIRGKQVSKSESHFLVGHKLKLGMKNCDGSNITFLREQQCFHWECCVLWRTLWKEWYLIRLSCIQRSREFSKRTGPQTLYLESKASNVMQNNKSAIYVLKLREYWPNHDNWFNNKLRDLDEHLRPWIIKTRDEKNVEAEVTNKR